MELDFREVAATLVIGGFVILLIESVFWFVFATNLTGFFRGRLGFDDDRRNTWIPFSVFVALSLPAGVISEDIALQVLEERPEVIALPASGPLSNFPDAMNMVRLMDKQALRQSALIRCKSAMNPNPIHSKTFGDCVAEFSSDNAPRKPILKECTPEVASGICFSNLLAKLWKSDPALQQCISAVSGGGSTAPPGERPLTSLSASEVKAIPACLTDNYYRAKNRVFLEDNYHDELRRLDARRRITGAFAFYSLLGMLALVGFALSARASEMILHNRTHHDIRKRVLLSWVLPAVLALLAAAATSFSNQSQDTPHDTYWNTLFVLAMLAVCLLADLQRRNAKSPSQPLLTLAASASLTLLAFLTFHIIVTFEVGKHDPFFINPFRVGAYFISAIVIAYLSMGSVSARNRAREERTAILEKELHKQHHPPYWPKPSRSVPILCSVLCMLYFGGLAAQNYEASEFNKRVFGYYSDLLLRDQARDLLVRQFVEGIALVPGSTQPAASSPPDFTAPNHTASPMLPIGSESLNQ